MRSGDRGSRFYYRRTSVLVDIDLRNKKKVAKKTEFISINGRIPLLAVLFERRLTAFKYFFLLLRMLLRSSVTDMGHGGPRTVPHDNDSLLSRCNGFHSHVRRHKRRVFQRCSGLVSSSLVPWILTNED